LKTISHEGIIYQLKFLKKKLEEKVFFANSFNQFALKISCNMKIFSSVSYSLKFFFQTNAKEKSF